MSFNNMKKYVDSGHQLVVELYAIDLRKSMEFYLRLGFELVRDDGNFVELKWEDTLLFIEQVSDQPAATHAVGNIRIMVPDVDHYWNLARALGARVIRPIENKYYGLRDFTIEGPDGLGLRFATRLEDVTGTEKAL
jgi:catechol 2,3-dioxygenase-like lactoylglutathione lyase family enzyme